MGELRKLGRYELRRVLGKGAMGVVYEGFDPSLNRAVAVKTVLKSVVTDEETAASYSARFAREARAAGRLSHPHIVQVYDFGEENDVAYLAMEFIQGRELRSCFEARQRFDAAEAVRIMGELLDALEFAHQAGVIHRDVKPANIMLDEQRRVKLADFGVARIQDGTDRSKSGGMVGTPAFMSPEQITGSRLDRRSDVFSAGIVLYQLLTNEVPFKGDGAWTVAKQIMQDEPPRPSTVATKVSPAFDLIINRALAKKPDQRYASAKDFSSALHGALKGDLAAGAQRGNDAEIEFWRAVQNSNDPAEFEAYLKEFPAGLYADLARIKAAKLPRLQANEVAPPAAITTQPPSQRSGELTKLAEETAKLEAEIAQREAEYRKREAEAEAKRQAEEKTRAEAEARREAEFRKREAEAEAGRQADEKARLAAIEKAKQEAAAEAARREAEYRKREAEAVAKAEAEAKTRREIEARAKKEAEVRAQVEAEVLARTQAEAEARAKRQAEAQEKEKRQAEEFAKRQAEIQRREEELKKRLSRAPRREVPIIPASIALLIIAAVSFGAWYWTTSSDEARLAQLTAALEAATKATQELNVARQRQDDLRRQVEIARAAEDDARAKGDQAKLKELQEKTKLAEAEAQKQNELVKQREAEAKKADDAAKVADAKKQTEASKAADKATQERLAQEKAALEKATAEKAAAEKATSERAAAEKLAADKASVEKAAVEKVAAAKTSSTRPVASAGRPGVPSVGDRWVYEEREANHPDKKYPITVDLVAVTPSSVRDSIKVGDAAGREIEYTSAAALISSGQSSLEFMPYLRAFQEIRVGDSWAKVETARAQTCSQGFVSSCSVSSARVVGREQVSVKAGSFDAWKIEIEYSMVSTDLNTRPRAAVLTYWYSEGARRFVKQQFRCRTCTVFPETDRELVSYTPAGGQAAAQRPAVTGSSIVAAMAPGVGDRWLYEARETNHPEKSYPIIVKVLAVTASTVRDLIKAGDGAEFEREQKAVPALNYGGQLGIVEFLPYLRAFQEIRIGEIWAKVNAAESYPACNNGTSTCTASARVVGRERVSVKAGTFDAWKIEVEEAARVVTGTGMASILLTYWYVEEVRRFVKYQHRCNGCLAAPNMDMELVSYTPAAARAAPGKSDALEQLRARVGSFRVMAEDPPRGAMQLGEVVYVNDRSCPDGEIKELTGAPIRTHKCVKLTP